VGTLIVRDVDDDLVTRLHRRAAAYGRSAEAEHREILRQFLIEGSSDMPFDNLRGKIRIAPNFDRTSDEINETMEGGGV
jgi:hypothetical protein